MRAIILAGGFGKRLGPLGEEVTKPLLPLRGRPAIEYILARLFEVGVGEVVISTNLKFKNQFKVWLLKVKPPNTWLEVEPSEFEEQKLGAIGAIARIVDRLCDDDYFVIAGDNVFTDSLSEMMAFFHQIRKPVVAAYHAANMRQLMLGSSVTTDSNGRIIHFEEKPIRPDLRKLVGACIYVLPYNKLLRTKDYVDEGMNADEPGRFISWLCERDDVYVCLLKGRVWDIGSVEEYERAKREFT